MLPKQKSGATSTFYFYSPSGNILYLYRREDKGKIRIFSSLENPKYDDPGYRNNHTYE